MVNRTIGTELEPGNVYCSAPAQRHMVKDHPADFGLIIPRLELIIFEPTWIGQAPRHGVNIEFVKRIAIIDPAKPEVLERHIALLAVCMEPDQYGDYRVVSGYIIKQEDIDSRITAQRLFVPK